MAWQIKSLKPLAATSIVLSLAIWTIVCYSFVLNSIELLSLGIAISKRSEIDGSSIDVVVIAYFVITHLIKMMCEALLIALLVVQFLSSFDYLTGDDQEYRVIWKDCHRKIFPLNIIILIVSLCLFLSSMNFYFMYEVCAITINFLFLLTVIALEMEGIKSVSQEVDKNCNSGDKIEKEVCSSQEKTDYNINICSFLETNSSSEKEINICKERDYVV